MNSNKTFDWIDAKTALPEREEEDVLCWFDNSIYVCNSLSVRAYSQKNLDVKWCYIDFPRSKEKDLLKLATAVIKNLEWDNSCDFGYIRTHPKRPFGNSCVELDILKIIGIGANDDGDYTNMQKEYARKLYKEDLIPFLIKWWINMIENRNQYGEVNIEGYNK